MTLNGVMALTLCYFNEFDKPAFQLISAYSSIELIDQKLAFTTDRVVMLVGVTKFTVKMSMNILLLVLRKIANKQTKRQTPGKT